MLGGAGLGVSRVDSVLTRRNFIGASLLAGLSPAISWSDSHAREVGAYGEYEIQRLRVEGSALEISVSGQPGVGEVLLYTTRRYFYEINSDLSQEDIVDVSNIDSYIAVHGDFPLAHRIKQGFAVLLDCRAYPPGSEEILGDIDSMVMEDILDSLGGKLYWGGSEGSKLVSYLGVSDRLGRAEMDAFNVEAEKDSYLSDQGPGAESDMFTT